MEIASPQGTGTVPTYQRAFLPYSSRYQIDIGCHAKSRDVMNMENHVSLQSFSLLPVLVNTAW